MFGGVRQSSTENSFLVKIRILQGQFNHYLDYLGKDQTRVL